MVGLRGIVASEIGGFGPNLGKTEICRGAECAVICMPMITVETLVPDEIFDGVVGAISTATRTGKVFTLHVQSTARVHTGEMNDNARRDGKGIST